MGLKVSVILNDMNRTTEASYGFRSWMLQNCDFDFEVVCTLFNNRKGFYEELEKGKSIHCRVIYDVHAPPKFFNISIANNLGLIASQGEYVFFCNSDIIYPSTYLQRAIAELDRRKICYACGARMNLREEFMRRVVKNPSQYTLDNNYDRDLVGLEWGSPAMFFWGNGSPWMVRRDVALAIGGFAPELVCYEERDFEDRVMHYLQKERLQDVGFAFTFLYGYHIWHPRGELYDIGAASKQLIIQRRQALRSDNTVAQVSLASREELLSRLYAAEPPALPKRPPVWRSLWRRFRQAASVLIKGN
jgi:glycosyltransferase involved in cell wall biosynthesis